MEWGAHPALHHIAQDTYGIIQIVMSKKAKLTIILVAILIAVGAIILVAMFLGTHNIAVLNPKGVVAEKQRQLIIVATSLMALVVVPVLAMTFGIAWRYRASNTKAKYSPELAGNRIAETVWWLVPIIIISALAVIAWTSSHDLDPFKPLASNVRPIKIQVIALQWKWLFIYPEQRVATINSMPIPTDTPIDFEITADAPMNSFWIPQLGGQVYAMPGMSTQLHLMATAQGDYYGSSANISGAGFAGMKFTAHATSAKDFTQWASKTALSSARFTQATYDELAKPSSDAPPAAFSFDANELYDTVVMKYMGQY